MSTQINIFVGNQQLLQKVKARVAANANALAERTRLKKDLEKIRLELEPALQEELRSSGNVDPFKEQGVFDGSTAYAGIGATRKRKKVSLPHVVSVVDTELLPLYNTTFEYRDIAEIPDYTAYHPYVSNINDIDKVPPNIVYSSENRNNFIAFADHQIQPRLWDSTSTFASLFIRNPGASFTPYRFPALPSVRHNRLMSSYVNEYVGLPAGGLFSGFGIYWVTIAIAEYSTFFNDQRIYYKKENRYPVPVNIQGIGSGRTDKVIASCNNEYIYISTYYSIGSSNVWFFQDYRPQGYYIGKPFQEVARRVIQGYNSTGAGSRKASYYKINIRNGSGICRTLDYGVSYINNFYDNLFADDPHYIVYKDNNYNPNMSQYIPASLNYNPSTGMTYVLTGTTANKADPVLDNMRTLYKREDGQGKTWLEIFKSMPKSTTLSGATLKAYGFEEMAIGVTGKTSAAEYAFTFDGEYTET